MPILARTATLIALLLLLLTPTGAQNWPARPIKMVVSMAAGSGPDIICRLISDKLATALGQQLVVENRPGGTNMIGAVTAARATADGYTLYFATAAALASNPHTIKALPYNPIKDFVMVSIVAKGPFLILANPSMPANTLPELIAYDKTNPAKLAFATDGPKNFSGLLATWLNKLSGANILQVPYATMPQGVQDTIAGRTQLTIVSIPVAAPHIASGTLKPIAVSWSKRLPRYPTVPTISETYPGVEVTGWFAIVAPTGTPADIVMRLNRELSKILKDPEVVKRLDTLGFFTEDVNTPEAAELFEKTQYELWGKVIREIGLQPE
jgi:tripartite-type tricarboxylate transporter receptor subunit TctC